jgi:hypothetical protein
VVVLKRKKIFHDLFINCYKSKTSHFKKSQIGLGRLMRIFQSLTDNKAFLIDSRAQCQKHKYIKNSFEAICNESKCINNETAGIDTRNP